MLALFLWCTLESFSMVKHTPYAVLHIPDFRFFLLARVCANIAVKMQGVIVGWQIYSLTKDPLALGLIGLAEAVPALSVALYAGYLADKTSRKNIVACVYGTLLVCTIGLVFLATGSLQHLFPTTVKALYGIIFITGLARGFMAPAMFGLMTQCVPSHLYANSSTWNSTLGQISMVVGAAFSGVLFAFTGFVTSYVVNAFFLVLALIMIASISAKEKPVLLEGRNLLENLLSGVRFVFKNEIFLGALSLDLFAVLFGGAVALLPIFADEILHTGPQGLGFLRAAPSAGAFLMAIYLIYQPPLKNTGKYLMYCVGGFGVCMILFALSRNFYLSLILLFISGAFDNVSVVVRSIIMQTLTPPDMKGRVSSVNSMFIGSSNEIGAFESGMTARFFGTVPSVILGGIMTLLVVGVTAVKAPLLRKLRLEDSSSAN